MVSGSSSTFENFLTLLRFARFVCRRAADATAQVAALRRRLASRRTQRRCRAMVRTAFSKQTVFHHQTRPSIFFFLKKKTFDTVEHSSVRMALRAQGIEEPYIEQLTKLYDIYVKSKHFHLERGTKHRDPRSTLLFSSLLQYMKPPTGMWKRCNHGFRLAEHDPTRISPTSDLRTTISGSEAHHQARRPHHNYDGTRPTTPPQQMQDQFIPSGKRSERNTLLNSSLFALSEFQSPTRDGPRPGHSGPWSKSALCLQSVD